MLESHMCSCGCVAQWHVLQELLLQELDWLLAVASPKPEQLLQEHLLQELDWLLAVAPSQLEQVLVLAFACDLVVAKVVQALAFAASTAQRLQDARDAREMLSPPSSFAVSRARS